MKKQTKPKREKAEVGNKKSSRDITDRKRIEEALIISELKYRRLFESAKDGILILDYETGTIVDVNPFLIRLLGLRQEELLGKKIWELGFFKDVAANQANFLKLQQKEFIRYENLPLENADGQRRNLEFVSNVYLVNSHKVIQCNIRDITKRKQAEDALKESEDRFRRFTEATIEGLVFHEQGRIVDANPAAIAMFGFSDVTEPIGRNLLEFIAPENHELVLKQMQLERVQPYEIQGIRKDGSTFPVETSTRVYKAGDHTIRASSLRDITGRKQAEEELRHSEEKFHNLFNNSEVGMFITRLDGSEILEFNEKYLKILGYTFDEVKGKASVDMWADKQERDRMVQLLKAEGRVTDFECGILNKQGEVRRCITSLRLYRDTGILEGSIQDITERKRMEEALVKEQHDMQAIMNYLPVKIYFKDRASRFIRISKSQTRLFGLSDPEQAIGKTDFDFFTKEHAQQAYEDEQAIIQTGQPLIKEERETWADHPDTWVSTIKMPVRDNEGNIIGTFGLSTDITEHKRMEEELRENEARYRLLFDSAPMGILLIDTQGKILEVNPAALQILGSPSAEATKNINMLTFQPLIEAGISGDFQKVVDNAQPTFGEYPYTTKWSKSVFITLRFTPLFGANGNLEQIQGVFEDITERKLAEEALAKEQYEMQTLMNYLPTYIYFKDRASRFTRISKSQALRFGLSDPAQAIGKTDSDFFAAEHAQQAYEDEQAIIQTGQPLIKEEKETWADRPNRWVSTIKMPMRDNEGNIIGTFGISTDITERKQAEEELAQERNLLRSLIDHMPDYVYVKDTQSRFLVANPALARLIGAATPDELLGKTDFDFFPQELAAKYYADEQAIFQSGQPVLELEEPAVDIAGNKIWVSSTKVPLRNAQGKIVGLVGMGRDITERKQSEQAIRQHVAELETLYESGLILSQLLSPKEIAQKLIDLMNTKLDWHHTVIRLYHPEDETLELLAFNLPATMNTAELQTTEERFKSLITKAGDGLSGWTVQHRQAVRVGELTHDSRYVETEPDLHSGMYVPLKVGERVVGVISIESEKPEAFSETDERLIITLANQAAVALENSRLHEETLHQLKRLEALHVIDQSIAGSFDQRSTLDVLLTHTLDQLEADAAVIFLLQPYQRTLQYAVGKGFHTHIIETADLKLGESLVGQAITERRIIHVDDREDKEPHSALAKLWLEEGFKCMDSVSLISKGQVKGVLSVYHRKAFTPSLAWSRFLETLAGQAAIAIDSTQLFNSLQQANMELAIAYDATIEGWSRAMDLRDEETEGHTERVTEMSMRLGKAMELGEEYLVHLRRGALLHDIGKLGVPDSILLKADKLTDEEWQIMKKHPQLAYDMLYSVAYLRRALDIPYCHHEKWDGTGYPRGLKSEQIPLAARIFAIVDVWDALTSDRPYRKAWSKPDALKYIREQSGKHFDPQVVDIFLKEFGHE
jgi:PAS domain S-box-containing protein